MNNGGSSKPPDDFLRSLFGAHQNNQQPSPKPARSLEELLAALHKPTPPSSPQPQKPENFLANLITQLNASQAAPVRFVPKQVNIPPPTVKLFKANGREATAAQIQYSKDITASIRQSLKDPLTVSKTTSVPKRENIGLNDGKLIESAVLYIDIRQSTSITTRHTDDVAAKIYKAFHESMVSIARYQGRGHVRGFAGDKIMVIFDNSGDAVTRAIDCAIWMQSYIEQKLSPALQTTYNHPISCGIGIDYGKMTVVRAGTKNNNDVVWAGSPANKASKLADSTPGGAIDVSYKAMERIKTVDALKQRFSLPAAKSIMVKEGDKLVTHYRLAKIRYTL